MHFFISSSISLLISFVKSYSLHVLEAILNLFSLFVLFLPDHCAFIYLRSTMEVDPKGYPKRQNYVYYAQICRPEDPEDESIEVEYEIQEIENHRFKGINEDYLTVSQIEFLQKPLQDVPDCELEFLIKWAGVDQHSWQPGQNLKNAPQILESYKRYYSQRKNMSTVKGTNKRGRKPKNNPNPNVEKSRGTRGRGFNFNRVYKESEDNLKICQDEEDELEIIDKETYIKGTREPSLRRTVEPNKAEINKVNEEQLTKLKVVAEQEYDEREKADILRWQKQSKERKERLKLKREKVNKEMKSMGLHNLNEDDIDFNSMEQGQKQSKRNTCQPPAENISPQINGDNLSKQGLLKPIDEEFVEKKEIQVEIISREVVPQPLNNSGMAVNERSRMLTQEQKTPMEIEHVHRGIENVQIQCFKPEEENLMPGDYEHPLSPLSNISPLEQIIDLFVMKKSEKSIDKKEINKTPNQNRQASPCNPYKEADIFDYRALQNNPLISQHQQQKIIRDNQQQINHLKRDLRCIMTPIGSLTKKIKPNEELQPSQGNKAITINLLDDEIELEIRRGENGIVIRQQIQKEISNLLLAGGNLNMGEILQDDSSLPLQKPIQPIRTNTRNLQGNHCQACQRHEEQNNQLRYLFNELLQNNIQLNLDTLLLQQQTFSVLSSLNPNAYCYSAPERFIRSDKLADISENSTLRILISRKIASSNNIAEIVMHYDLQKLIKMGEEWFGIFQVKSPGQRQAEHYKYVQASDLLQHWRELVVRFLMK